MVRLRGGQGKGGIFIYWEYVSEEGIFGLFEEKKETEKEKKENLLNKEKLLSAWLITSGYFEIGGPTWRAPLRLFGGCPTGGSELLPEIRIQPGTLRLEFDF